MLAFNYLDYVLTDVLEAFAVETGKGELLPKIRERTFGRKLELLDRFRAAEHGHTLQGVSTPDLEQVTALRNCLAHGHVEFSHVGTYILEDIRRRVLSDWDVGDIIALEQRILKLAHDLKYAQAYFAFKDDGRTDG